MLGIIAKASDALLSRLVPKADAAASSGCYLHPCDLHFQGCLQLCCPSTGCGGCHCP